MIKFFIGLIAGLTFYHFLPQVAMALSDHRGLKHWTRSGKPGTAWKVAGISEKGKEGCACNETARKGIIQVRELKQSDEQIFQRFLKHEGYDAIARDNCTTPERIRQIVVKQQQRIAKQKEQGEQRMNQEQLNALYGPSASHSEHHRGDSVQFRAGNEIKAGTILHVRAPGPTHEGGREHSMLYMVDTGEGFPVPAFPSQIVQGTFQAVLATYGFPGSALSSREQAEALAVNVEGQVIETEQCRLRVIKARVEDNEAQGQVLAECEAMEGEEGH